MNIQIMPVDSNDFVKLYEIEQQSYQQPWSYQILADNQGKDFCNLKLMLNDEIIGFTICRIVLDEAHLYNIAIHPQYQHQGYGDKLLNTLFNQLRAHYVSVLWLEVRESNSSAKNLYEKLGFNQVGIRKNYYPTENVNVREDALIMGYWFV